jgi:hypothetical protein
MLASISERAFATAGRSAAQRPLERETAMTQPMCSAGCGKPATFSFYVLAADGRRLGPREYRCADDAVRLPLADMNADAAIIVMDGPHPDEFQRVGAPLGSGVLG